MIAQTSFAPPLAETTFSRSPAVPARAPASPSAPATSDPTGARASSRRCRQKPTLCQRTRAATPVCVHARACVRVRADECGACLIGLDVEVKYFEHDPGFLDERWYVRVGAEAAHDSKQRADAEEHFERPDQLGHWCAIRGQC